jgi:hypothetical protein
MVIALAGRRIDAEATGTARFPLRNVPAVRDRIGKALRSHGATALVCAGACGADLIALDVAGELALRRRIVLPFPAKHFREKSVVDRPGDWGVLFDRILKEVKPSDLVVLQQNDDDQALLKGNDGILRNALELAGEMHRPAIAFVVWDGSAREDKDLTADFRSRALALKLKIVDIKTN